MSVEEDDLMKKGSKLLMGEPTRSTGYKVEEDDLMKKGSKRPILLTIHILPFPLKKMT